MRAVIASGTAPPNMPEWTPWSRVVTVTTTRIRPRSVVVRAGSPMAQLVESASTMASARSFSPCFSSRVGSESEPISSSPSTKTVTPTGRAPGVGAQRGEVGHDAGLVVGGAAAVEPAVALGRLERRAVPVLVVAGRLHVVVRVEHDRGRDPRGPSRCPMTAGRPPSRTISTSRPSARSSAAVASALASTWAWSNASRLTLGMRVSVLEVRAQAGHQARRRWS